MIYFSYDILELLNDNIKSFMKGKKVLIFIWDRILFLNICDIFFWILLD